MIQLVRADQLAHNKTIFSLLALATHFVLYKGEWDNRFHYFLGLWLVSFGGLATAEYLYDAEAKSVATVAQITASAAAVYFSTLVASILLHRGFFHRLRRVSLPFICPSHRYLNLNRFPARSSHVSPNSTASLQVFFPDFNTSSGARNSTKSTRQTSFEPALERSLFTAQMPFPLYTAQCRDAKRDLGTRALAISEAHRHIRQETRRSTSADARLGITPSTQRHFVNMNLA